MKIQFWSVGKANEPYVNEGIDVFTKRISYYYPIDWKIISPPKNAANFNNNELKESEGKSILEKLESTDTLILLDEKGKIISSEELATFISQKGNESARKLVFLIGGAYG